ncbi:DMT family transporter [Mycolicibacterium diernhoferi]|nr:DMT family transporter [Mycolicibacterium diernhoferi]QYL20974.1 DMT family transporter [Mycolicibacterium diernhoferi]
MTAEHAHIRPTDFRAPTRGRAWTAGAASGVAYGLTPVAAVFGFSGGTGPAVLLTVRGLFALTAIGLLCVFMRRFRRVPIGAAVGLICLCGPMFGLQVLAYFAAIEQGGAQLSVVLVHVYPIVVILLVALRNRAPVSGPSCALVGVILAGLVLVTLTTGATAPATAIGCALLSAAGYAVYLVASERWVHRVGTVLSTLMVTVGATATVGIVALVTGQSFAISPSAWQVAALQGLVLLPIGLCGALYAVRTLGSVPVSILGTLEPVVGVLAAAVLLHERLTPTQWAGVAVILAACAMLPWVAPRRDEEADAAGALDARHDPFDTGTGVLDPLGDQSPDLVRGDAPQPPILGVHHQDRAVVAREQTSGLGDQHLILVEGVCAQRFVDGDRDVRGALGGAPRAPAHQHVASVPGDRLPRGRGQAGLLAGDRPLGDPQVQDVGVTPRPVGSHPA